MIVDLFAGIGWALGLRTLGLDEHGIDVEPTVAETRDRLGVTTTLGDITELDPAGWAGADGLIASPPCQSWSVAGKGLGLDDQRGRLVWEPLRWARAIRPRWVACEQVPPAEGAFRVIARQLEEDGYRAVVCRLSAEEYGVPQTRERVYLLAHRDRAPRIPTPSHQQYHHARPRIHPVDAVGLLPWVSMAEALGWPDGITLRANNTTSSTGERYTRPVDAPSPTVGSRADLWCFERPSTTLCADPRVAPPWHHDGSQMRDSVKLTLAEGCTLMGFPPEVAAALPSTAGAAWRIVGNAVCPPMAARVVEGLA